MRAVRLRVGLVAVVASTLLVACSSEQDTYCDAVRDHQSDLAEVTKGDPSTALLEALPIFTDLQGKAPADIRGDWRTVTTAVQGLRDALDAAGVDPATYDRDHPPAGVSQARRTAIDEAAAGLTRQTTVTALSAVQQQSLDVCHTPLSL